MALNRSLAKHRVCPVRRPGRWCHPIDNEGRQTQHGLKVGVFTQPLVIVPGWLVTPTEPCTRIHQVIPTFHSGDILH